MLIAAPLVAGLAPSAADGARVAAELYTVALAATLPLLAAVIAAVVLRRLPAGTRALVWRAAVVALLCVVVGQLVPLRWRAWVVPGDLASPLVVLGRLQLAADARDGASGRAIWDLVALIPIIYVGGVIVVLTRLTRAWRAARGATRRARAVVDTDWLRRLQSARQSFGIGRRVRLVSATDVADAAVPMTWGILRPVIVLPAAALSWSDEHRRIVLLHELAHVRAADAAFGIAARIACALLWFHPGVWWVSRRLRDVCEVAADDCVLSAGVRPSDYAELLVMAADALAPCAGAREFGVAVSQRTGLRGRLAAIVDTRLDRRAPARVAIACTTVITLSVAAPASSVQLVPTREVLTTLMRDARWDSRAFAVIGLARRADSIAVARAAAALDPSPRVRAWARYALAQQPSGSNVPATAPTPARP
jgi:beta-lactamase regulating signal transducer with metallopeptidase domain